MGAYILLLHCFFLHESVRQSQFYSCIQHFSYSYVVIPRLISRIIGAAVEGVYWLIRLMRKPPFWKRVLHPVQPPD